MTQTKDISKYLPLTEATSYILLPVLTLFVIKPATTASSLFEFYAILKTIMGLFLILYVYAMLRIFGWILELTKK